MTHRPCKRCGTPYRRQRGRLYCGPECSRAAMLERERKRLRVRPAWHFERINERRRQAKRAEVIAMGGPWPCAWCGSGEVWKAYAKYCSAECRREVNRFKQRERDARRVERPNPPPVQKKPPALIYRRAASLAECG